MTLANRIPVLVRDDGGPACAEGDILEYLSGFDESPAHREKAR